jgi:small subunit ribosomal protein S9
VKYEKLGENIRKSIVAKNTKESLTENKTELINSVNTSALNNLTDYESYVSTKKVTDFYGKGKRKKAVAYAHLKPGKGVITINGKEFNRYFNHPEYRGKIMKPLILTETTCQYDLELTLQGGGANGQADAAIPAISKALIKINPEWRSMLAKELYLKHDPRNVEPKKPGRIKARKGYVYNRR